MIDLVLRNDRVPAGAETVADIGIDGGRIVAIEPALLAEAQELDVGGRLVAPAGHVNCSLSTNNVLNPFTPFGDCSLVRMANLFANVAHVGRASEMADCFDMVTRRSARILRLDDYGVEVGRSADLVVLDRTSAESAVAEVAQPLYGFERGRRTFSRLPAELHRP